MKILDPSKKTASFRIVDLMLAIALLWLATASTSAQAQTSNDDANVSTNTAAASSLGDWTQFRGDNMQRWNPDEKALGVNNAGNLQLKWSRSFSFSSFQRQSDPVVANGVVYFNADHLYAFNASTGQLLWTSTAAGSVSTPAVANGVVYFLSNDGNLYALNARTGTKLWSSFLNGPSLSPPFDLVVADGEVYASGGFRGEGSCGGGTLFALDAGSGALLWTFASTTQSILYTPAVANGAVYFVGCGSSSPNALLALNAKTGAVLWDFSTGFNGGFYSPVVANGTVFFNSDASGTIAVNASTGKTQWTYPAGGGFFPPAVANGVLYQGVYALNATTGQKLWTTDAVTFNPNEVLGAAAVANGVVYFSVANYTQGGTSQIYALDASTGAKLLSYPLPPGSTPNNPIVSKGTVYFTDRSCKFDSNNNPICTTTLNALSIGADLFLRVTPSATTVHQGDLLTFAFPVWNLGPDAAVHEVLNTEVPAGTTFDYIRISGTPGLGTCTHPPFGGTGRIVCHENGSMAPNTSWTVRMTVKVTAPSGTVITTNAATMADTPDPNMANNMATSSIKVQ